MAVAACVVTLARRPDALSNPQFWAEDGAVFFQQAWNDGGFHELTTTYLGYLEEVQRLVAIPAASIGLRFAPALFNLVALAFQVAPACYFVSNRGESLVESRPMRVLVGAIYLLLPNAEINLNLTNVQWHLAILAFLIVVAHPARHRWARIAEDVVIVLAVLTGPFCFVLLTIAGVWYWKHRFATTRVFIALAAAGTVIQLTASALGPGRPHSDLGAGVFRFIDIAANRVFLGGSFGQDLHNTFLIANPQSGAGLVWAVVVVGVGSVITGFAFWRGPLPLRLFIAFGAVIFVGGLLSPAAGTKAVWTHLILPADASRYFFIAQLAWILSLMWVVTRSHSKTVSAALVAAVCFGVGLGVASEWRYPEFPDLNPDIYVTALNRAKAGHVVTIPLNPIYPADLLYVSDLELFATGHVTAILPRPVNAWAMELVAH
jgi:hypothetical protein